MRKLFYLFALLWTAVAVQGQVTVTTLEELNDELSSAVYSGATFENPYEILIGADIDIDDGLEISSNSDTVYVLIKSAATGTYTLKRAEGYTSCLIGIWDTHKVTLENLILDGNKEVVTDVESDGFLIGNYGFLKLNSGVVLKNNKISGSGGAIKNDGILIATGTVFAGNEAGNGGALFNGSGPSKSCVLTDVVFTDNKAAQGGALMQVGRKLIMTGGSFIRNSCTVMGGAFVNNTQYVTDVVELTGVTFSENDGALMGGAIANMGVMTVSDCTFSKNYTSLLMAGASFAGSGGAIGNYAGALKVSGGTFSENTALNNGGAIYHMSQELTLSGVTISKNTATVYGNGIFQSSIGYSLIVAGATKIGTSDTDNGIYFEGATENPVLPVILSMEGLSAGASINIEGMSEIEGVSGITPVTVVVKEDASDLTATDLAFFRAQKNSGNMVRLLNGNIVLEEIPLAATYAQLVDRIDKSQGTLEYPSEIHVTADLELISGELASVVIPPGKHVLIKSADASAVKTLTRAAGFTGTLFKVWSGASLVFSDIVVDGAKGVLATECEAIASTEGGVIEVREGAVLKNNRSDNGGALYNKGGTLRISGGEISGNEAKTSGGAIYNLKGDTDANLIISGGVIKNNKTESKGGAVYNQNGLITISGGTISKNESDGEAGAIYNYGGNITITAGLISENKAVKSSSGAIDHDLGILTISGGTISNNSAPAGFAGAIRNAGTMLVTGGTITGNTALVGGAIYHTSTATLTISGNPQIGTSATDNGIFVGAGMNSPIVPIVIARAGLAEGAYIQVENASGKLPVAIAVPEEGETLTEADLAYFHTSGKRFFYLVDGGVYLDVSTKEVATFEDLKNAVANAPANGTEIEILVTADINLAEGSSASHSLMVPEGRKVVIKSKDASTVKTLTRAGGHISTLIRVLKDATLTLENLIIDGADAAIDEDEGNGPIIYIQEGLVNIKPGTVLKNNQSHSGGAINNYGGTIRMSGGEISGNESQRYGGAIYNHESESKVRANLIISGGVIKDNKSEEGGGAIYNQYSDIVISGGTISGNSTSGNGGAIRNAGTLIITGGTMTGNTSERNGSAISYGNNATLTLSGAPQIGTSAPDNGIYFSTLPVVPLTIAEAGLAQGASVKIEGFRVELPVLVAVAAEGKTLSKSDLAFFVAPEKCGFYVTNDSIYMAETVIDVYNLDELTAALARIPANGFEVDIVVHEDIEMPSALEIPDGTAITLKSGDAGNVKTLLRSAEYTGAMITNLGEDAVFTIEHLTIDGNKANVLADESLIRNAGSLTLKEGATLQNNKIEGNGGAVLNEGTLNLSGGTISGNAAFLGDAIYYKNGYIVLSGTPKVGSATSGEGIYFAEDKVITISQPGLSEGASVHIEETYNGLPVRIAVAGSGVTITDADLAFFSTPDKRGLYVDGGQMYMAETLIDVYTLDELTAALTRVPTTGFAVKIRLHEDLEMTSALEIPNGTAITLQSADAEDVKTLTRNAEYTGVLIKSEGAKTVLTLDSLTLDGNKAHVTASASLVENGGSLILKEGMTLQNNSTSGNGGAVFTEGTLTLSGCTLTENAAETGGDVYVKEGAILLSGTLLIGSEITESGLYLGGDVVALVAKDGALLGGTSVFIEGANGLPRVVVQKENNGVLTETDLSYFHSAEPYRLALNGESIEFSDHTGLELIGTDGFGIYPGLVHGGEELTLQLPAGTDAANVSIYATSGTLVASYPDVSGRITAPTQSGLYVVRIETSKGQSEAVELIVK